MFPANIPTKAFMIRARGPYADKKRVFWSFPYGTRPAPYRFHVRAGVCRPCVETKLTATEKSATDGDRLVTTLGRHNRAYDRIQLVADRKSPVAESGACSTSTTICLLTGTSCIKT